MTSVETKEIRSASYLKGPKERAMFDEHRATLVWEPMDEKKRTRREESEYIFKKTCLPSLSQFNFKKWRN